MAFSGWRVLKEGLSGHRGWTPLWRAATPKKEYDLIIIGGWRGTDSRPPIIWRNTTV
jgi:hypothetical protein